MMRRLFGLALAVAVVLAAFAQPQQQQQQQGQHATPPRPRQVREPLHKPFSEPLTAKKIQIAIDDAIAFLRSQQRPDGSIGSSPPGHPHLANTNSGSTGLAALAMLAAGADPSSDSCLQRALDFLLKQDDDNTYVRGITANVWEYALRKAPYDERFRQALKKDYDWLMQAFKNNGRAWRYRLKSTDWDNSVTQYGVLGVWAAQRAGYDPGDAFWQKMSKHFLECQRPDGGWAYQMGESTPNMATAGLASMFLVFDMYHGKSFYSAKNPRALTEGEAAECLKSLERCMEWLGRKGPHPEKDTAYYLYGIERAGVASGRKYFGGEDWFKQGALSALKRQGPSGEISTGGGAAADVVTNTSWCVLFLVYGGAPAAFDKLEYGDGSDWNLNPRDLANVAKYLWSAYERPLRWESVSIAAPVTEFEAPILFISGSKAAKFTDDEVKKLREYIDRGGTILAEPSDGSREFAESMQALLSRMFGAAAKLKPLPSDHGVYTVLKQDWKKRPELLGFFDGTRTVFFLSKEYMSADWQVDKTDSDAFKLAMNLLFYATDLATMEGRFASILPETPPANEKPAVATVARVKLEGPQQYPHHWAIAPKVWEVFAPYLKHIVGCHLEEKPPVKLGESNLKDIGLLHLTGYAPLQLSNAERAALKKFVTNGGTVLVDAYAGSEAFAKSARAEIEAVFGTLTPLAQDSILATGRFEGGVNISHGIRYKLPARRLLREQGKPTDAQSLEVVTIDGRPSIIFSAFDLTGALGGIECYRAIGYKPESARKIVGNLLAYMLAD